MKDKKINLLLCGVGGQGTVLASRILAQAAMQQGLFARTAETIGMAQRGGSVTSHVRIGNKIHAPLIEKHGADMLLGFEPAEAVRCLPFLEKDGVVIVSSAAVQSVSSLLGKTRYEAEEMLSYLQAQVPCVKILDMQKIAETCGSYKVLNIALLGAAAALPEFPISQEQIAEVIRQRMPERLHQMNLTALRLGAAL